MFIQIKVDKRERKEKLESGCEFSPTAIAPSSFLPSFVVCHPSKHNEIPLLYPPGFIT
jgi:hypothetical protein